MKPGHTALRLTAGSLQSSAIYHASTKAGASGITVVAARNFAFLRGLPEASGSRDMAFVRTDLPRVIPLRPGGPVEKECDRADQALAGETCGLCPPLALCSCAPLKLAREDNGVGIGSALPRSTEAADEVTYGPQRSVSILAGSNPAAGRPRSFDVLGGPAAL